ncbi:hypothetical protein SEA_PANAMAXUS_51 [Mycobacterium phage Panamaxus]|uniref:RNA polymerase sigma factor n=1 Tax=Mycobacterium phage Veracruz TaxID=2530154 RepID=A0A481VTG8_9CAUD|nr:sigma-K factor [Mycobacterium phage Veracruz]AIS73726.1 putative sigma factor [Mycobacterium phage QuinnKiro]ALA11855.1 hypothetical protein SEA_TEXAGE_52 [Mycobacterium phage Texage]AOT24202.1 helix-turn-helix DNA binding domain protein [Mycobacterium phage Todacoro]AOT25555.1 helix-turn-helix DNA binding domain protein [Mycobacterium phage Margo]AUX82349.1 helix-turn-helix DNA-binding domain protein [Mycobacterium phage Lambert1]AVP42970.1 hypothetical protein SEA_PANAMAXUS_51 [Mycobacte
MTSHNDLEWLQPVVRKAAKVVALQWPGVIEADDAEQSIWLKLLESPGTVDKAANLDDLALRRFITRIGHQIASKERWDYAYYKGAYRYSVHEVKRLLKSGALKEQEQELKAQTFDKESVSTGKTTPTTQIPDDVMDLRRALIRVAERNEGYAEILIKRYRLDEFPADKSEASALTRAHDLLVKEMNRTRRADYEERADGPGTRRVLTNAQARNLSSTQYVGDKERSAAGWHGET